jgi:hypothetical protein
MYNYNQYHGEGILLEKVTVKKLIDRIPTFDIQRKRKFNAVFHKSPPLARVLSKLNSVHKLPHNFFKI